MKKVKSNGKVYHYECLHVMVSEDEKRKLKIASKELGISISDIIRLSFNRFLNAK